MHEQIRQIATRLRELREIAGDRPETAAAALGVASATYLAYEKGEPDIPVSFLANFAARYHVDLSSLLTGQEPRLSVYAVTRKGQGASVERTLDYRYQSLAGNFAHKKGEPFLVTVDPGPEGGKTAANAHPGQEFDFVLEGSLQILVGGHEVVLNEGDSIYFDSTAPHGMRALGGKSARFLAIIL
jgi:quercetin dioxygenase-like cupin family protein/DNA-binding XRE family transcriptional regulator